MDAGKEKIIFKYRNFFYGELKKEVKMSFKDVSDSDLIESFEKFLRGIDRGGLKNNETLIIFNKNKEKVISKEEYDEYQELKTKKFCSCSVKSESNSVTINADFTEEDEVYDEILED